MIFAPAWAAWLGAAAVAEAMMLSFYLSHDCAHLCAFATRRQNLVMGEILAFLSGGGVGGFGDYRRDHLRHHAEQVDFVGVDVNQSLALRWRPLRAAVELLEACYIPALFFIVKFETLRHDMGGGAGGRLGAAADLGLKLAVVATLVAVRPQALLWLVVAVFARIHCIRFVDAFQHTFEHGDLARRSRHRGWAYEQRHTFSFPVFKGLTFFNLLTLNFGYHNAHHAVPHCPWYNLPHLDAMLRRFSREPDASGQYPYQPEQAGVLALLKAYHKHRTHRLFAAEPDAAYDEDGRFSLTSFRGVLSDHLLG
jgi:fatty acid desaturase